MARIRTVKPEVVQHEVLYQLEQELAVNVRFAWVMLPSQADREGRFKWRVSPLKLGCLPYDNVDFSRVLDAWLTRGMLVKYRVGGEWYGWIPTWKKHQAINNREVPSELPGFESADEALDYRNQQDADACRTREGRVDDTSQQETARVADASRGEGKGREGKGRSVWNDASTTRAADVARTPGQVSDTAQSRPDPGDTLEYEQAIMAKYPKGPNPPNWTAALMNARALVDAGLSTWPELVAVTERYAAHYAAGSSVNVAAHNFFDRRKGDYWQQGWVVTANGTNGSGHGRKTYDDYARESADRLAAAGGEDPGPL